MAAKKEPTFDLTERMKKVQILDSTSKPKKKKSTTGKKKAVEYLIMEQPVIQYKWRDERKNTMLTMEVLMNGPLNLKNCTVELIEKNDGTQFISVRYIVPSSWLSEDYYSKTNNIDSWNGSRRFEARCEAVKNMEDTFGIGRSVQLTYEQQFDLPFRCDNPDKDPVYENTGFWFQQWCVLSRKTRPARSHQNFVDANVDGMVDTLVIQLVAEAKFQATKKQQRTPMKQLMIGAFEDDDYPPQQTTNVVSNDGLDMNLRAANSDEMRRTATNISYHMNNAAVDENRNQRRRTNRSRSRSYTTSRNVRRTSSEMMASTTRRENDDEQQEEDDERVGTSFETAGDDDTMETDRVSFT